MGYRDTFLNNYEDVEETSSPVTEVSPSDGVVTVENHLDLSFFNAEPEMEESKVETSKTSGISSVADSEEGYSNSGSSMGEYGTDDDDIFKLGKESKTDRYTDRMSLKERKAQEALEKENAKYNIEMPSEDNTRAEELQKEQEDINKRNENFTIRTPGEAFEKYHDPVAGAKGFVKEVGETAKSVGALLLPSTYKKLWNNMSEWVKSDKEEFTLNDKTYSIKGPNGKSAASFMEAANNKIRNEDGSVNVNNLLASTLFSEGYKGPNLSITKSIMDKISTADDTANFVRDMNENIWNNITPEDVYDMDLEDLTIFYEALLYQYGSSPSEHLEELISTIDNRTASYVLVPELNEIFQEYTQYRNELSGKNAATVVTDLMEDAMLVQSAVSAGANMGEAAKSLKSAGRKKRIANQAKKVKKELEGRLEKNGGKLKVGKVDPNASEMERKLHKVAANDPKALGKVIDKANDMASEAAKKAGKSALKSAGAALSTVALGAAGTGAVSAARTLKDGKVETPELSDTVLPTVAANPSKTTYQSSDEEVEDDRPGLNDEGYLKPEDKIIGTSGKMIKLRDKLKKLMENKYAGTENEFAIGKLMEGEISDEEAERTLKGDAEAVKEMFKALKEFKKATRPWNLIKSLRENGVQGTIQKLADIFGGLEEGDAGEVESLLKDLTIEVAAEDDPDVERPTEKVENTSEYGIGDKTSDGDEYNKGLKASDDRVKDFIIKNIAKDAMLRSWAGKLKR